MSYLEIARDVSTVFPELEQASRRFLTETQILDRSGALPALDKVFSRIDASGVLKKEFGEYFNIDRPTFAQRPLETPLSDSMAPYSARIGAIFKTQREEFDRLLSGHSYGSEAIVGAHIDAVRVHSELEDALRTTHAPLFASKKLDQTMSATKLSFAFLEGHPPARLLSDKANEWFKPFAAQVEIPTGANLSPRATSAAESKWDSTLQYLSRMRLDVHP